MKKKQRNKKKKRMQEWCLVGEKRRWPPEDEVTADKAASLFFLPSLFFNSICHSLVISFVLYIVYFFGLCFSFFFGGGRLGMVAGIGGGFGSVLNPVFRVFDDSNLKVETHLVTIIWVCNICIKSLVKIFLTEVGSINV